MKAVMIKSLKIEEFKLTGGSVLIAMIVFFAVIFAVNGVMAYLAVETFSGVQTDKPYENGLAFNQDIARARAQDAQGWRVDENITRGAGGDVLLSVRIIDLAHMPVSGLIVQSVLKAPADSHNDCSVTLTEQSAGIYWGTAHCGAGQWDADLTARKNGEVAYHSINRIILP